MPTHKKRQQIPKTTRGFGTVNLFRLPASLGIRMNCSFLAITKHSLVPFPDAEILLHPNSIIEIWKLDIHPPKALIVFTSKMLATLHRPLGSDYISGSYLRLPKFLKNSQCKPIPKYGNFSTTWWKELHTPGRDGINSRPCLRNSQLESPREIGETIY